MNIKTLSAGALLMLTACLASSGCSFPLNTLYAHPTITFPVPVPVSPYFQKRLEDKFWNEERYQRVPIMGPLTAGGPAVALDPPSEDEVMRALEKAQPIQAGVPFLHERQRNNVRMIIEPVADYVDPPRVYPLIGPAQLHHAHYKCTVFYTLVTRVGWPLPHTRVDEDSREVLYIDHNHFHMVDGCVDQGATAGM
ncbi:MAG TPA: hypothetical protein VIK18_10380 [Pirellulales bacterium]